MTVQAISPQVHGDLVADARRAVAASGALPAACLSDDELADGIVGLASLEAQVAAGRLALLAEVDRRALAQQLGATGTDAWVARLTGSTRKATAGGLWLARLLQDTYDTTRDAFAAGAINEAQATVIVRAAERLPAGLAAVDRSAAEALLVAKAVAGMDPTRLRQAGRRMLDVVSSDLADQEEAASLGAEERRAEAETWMTLDDNGDGTFSGRFTIPELHGHLLRAALEQLTSPRRWSRDPGSGLRVEDPTISNGLDALTGPERLGMGLTELIEHLPTHEFGRSGMTVMVHLDLERLLDGLASARLDTGAHLSAGEARRLACTAGIVPAVLGSASAPLDVGREARLHTTAMRRALSIGHDTCAAEGCMRPFAWCDVHHPHAWAHGGVTDIENALPLCGWHHRRVHDSRYRHRTLASGQIRFRRQPSPGQP
jgi:hypothetical protein